jgi:type IX secretion system substrate protein
MKTIRKSTTVLMPLVLLIVAVVMPATLSSQTPGKDGNKNVNGNEIVNTYTTLSANALSTSTTISVASNAGITAGDLVMIYQAQGATINSASNDPSYGTVTDYGSAGYYEVLGVQSVSGSNSITLATSLTNSYYTIGNVQVIRVPQYARLRVGNNGIVTAPTWNGQTGGVVAIHVQNTATINGTIRTNGLGFRGGELSNNGSSTNDYTAYRSSSPLVSAQKGEGIAGHTSTLPNGGYGRGAAANGGGGGNTHNAGGGGGANGDNLNAWTGAGIMCTSCLGLSAWVLDSAYIENGYNYTNSSGGGRGGYTYSQGDQDALTYGPGNPIWSGNLRRQRGGLGGRPLAIDPCHRVFLGGGGGAGNHNNSSGGAGGNGGGLVFLVATDITGSGSITANGGFGYNTSGTHNDAPGGGGAGGTVLLNASNSITSISISADGGGGGTQFITNNEAEGPGGGGGGGCIATTATNVTRSVNGGANGTTTSSALTEFPANGATSGASGEIHTDLCANPSPVELTAFSARKGPQNITLNWSTATEINNFGFEIERKAGMDWETIGFVAGAGNTSAEQQYQYHDNSVTALPHNGSVSYRLRQIDRDGSFDYSPAIEVMLPTSVVSMELEASPNPVQSQVSIRFSIGTEQRINLAIYNSLGQEMTRLAVDEYYNAGTHILPLNATDFPTGIYIVTLSSELGTIAKTIAKVK